MVTVADYAGIKSAWCPGCGNFGILRSLNKALVELGIEPHRVLMLGDSLVADVRGARGFGYRAALMLTGVTPMESLGRGGIQPDMVFERL